MSEAVDVERWGADLPGEPDEGAVEGVWAQRPSERVGEHERAVRVIDPGQSSQLPFVVLLTVVLGEHGACLMVERDRSGGGVRLAVLLPDQLPGHDGHRLPAEGDGPGIEVDVAPSQPEDLTSACAGAAGDTPCRMEPVVANVGEEAGERGRVPGLVAGVVGAGLLRGRRMGDIVEVGGREVAKLTERWRDMLRATSDPRAHAAAWTIIDLLPAHPVITAAIAGAVTGRAKAAVHNVLDQLVDAGVLEPVAGGRIADRYIAPAWSCRCPEAKRGVSTAVDSEPVDRSSEVRSRHDGPHAVAASRGSLAASGGAGRPGR